MAKTVRGKDVVLKKGKPSSGKGGKERKAFLAQPVKKPKTGIGSKFGQAKSHLEWTSVEQMRPTQCSVGFIEVGLKMGELRERARDPEELERYLRAHPIPAVMGPDGRMYLTDHHHMGLAMCKLSEEWDASARGAGLNPFRRCCFEIKNDYSDQVELCMEDFFSKMEALGLCHPYDGAGKRDGPPPRDLTLLQDDPYRSLAGLARKAGAFDKVDLPYTEFKWADFFRTRIDSDLMAQASLAQAIRKAFMLARTENAKDLPGFKGSKNGKAAPSIQQIKERLSSRHGAADDALAWATAD